MDDRRPANSPRVWRDVVNQETALRDAYKELVVRRDDDLDKIYRLKNELEALKADLEFTMENIAGLENQRASVEQKNAILKSELAGLGEQKNNALRHKLITVSRQHEELITKSKAQHRTNLRMSTDLSLLRKAKDRLQTTILKLENETEDLQIVSIAQYEELQTLLGYKHGMDAYVLDVIEAKNELYDSLESYRE
ncbi:hypothetical protein P154DRAFT_568859 [Amniculicola lignicola CBS 123094]|uniref:Uncharacterized protein n=1 Tax=Amniculicola lignicola CBS 123094 TaxID=1392246 RepID=A0A6A5X567_9PLEO|nr:hypothetical protein P154DRAFT_568859 [Amniculicola lignicola CBS 123094]